MNTGLHLFFWIMILSRYMPRIGITEWYGTSIFRFLRNLHTVLQSGYTNLPSQQCRFPFSSHSLLVLIDFRMMAILTGVRWYFIVVLISIFLMVLSIFSCPFLAMCMSLWRYVYLNFSPVFCWVVSFDIELHELFVYWFGPKVCSGWKNLKEPFGQPSYSGD